MSRRVPWLLCAIALVQGVAYSLLVPLWQGPDEPGHFEIVRLWSEQGRWPRPGDASPAVQSDIIASLARAGFWRFTRQATPPTLPATFADDPFLRHAGTQLGRQPATYYVVPSWLVRLTRDADRQARLVRWFSVLLSVLTVWVAARLGQVLFADEPLLAVGIPALLALGPMPAFVGSIINNDALANLSGALCWWMMALCFRHGATARRLALLGMALALALLSKRTAWYLLPTVLAAGLLYLRLRERPVAHRTRRLGAIGLAAAGIAVAALALWHPAQNADGFAAQAAGWRQRPTGGMAVLSQSAARSGRHSLWLEHGSAEQRVAAGPLQERAVTLTVWVRGRGTGCVRLDDEHGPPAERCAPLAAGWQAWSVALTVAPAATLVHVAVALAGPGTLLADDATLHTDDGAAWLRNGSMEARASALASLLDRVGWAARLLPDSGARLWNRASYDGASLARYGLYAALTFAGFWGNFGWLQVPLSLVWYMALALVCLAAVAGWGRLALGKTGWLWLHESPQRAAMAAFGLGLALALLQTFLPMVGRAWQPQGRYLFPALIPIAAWLLAGLGAWAPSPRARQALLLAWLAGLFLLNAVALAETIYPYYHPPLPGQRVF